MFPQAWDIIMLHGIFFQSSLNFWPIKGPYPYCAGSVHRKDVQKNLGKKAWSEKFFDQKIQQNLRILWKSLCKIEIVTKQFPQAWDIIMPHRIFFQSSLSFWLIKCWYPYFAGSLHRKDVQNFWPPLNNAPGF